MEFKPLLTLMENERTAAQQLLNKSTKTTTQQMKWDISYKIKKLAIIILIFEIKNKSKMTIHETKLKNFEHS